MSEVYRQCAGAVVFNTDGKVLLCSRIDVSGEHWQFPQGGIEAGETPETAARRELFEETSIQSVLPVYTDEFPNRYTFPDDVIKRFESRGIYTAGQDIYFTLFYFNGKDNEINLNTRQPEFKSYIWQDLQFAASHIVSFKKAVYEKISKRFAPLIQQYLDNMS